MKIWVLIADTVYDCAGEVFSEGYVVDVFSSYETVERAFDTIEDNYTRRKKDYTIKEFDVKD